MAQTHAEYLDALKDERDVIQAKLKAIADDGASYSLPGALPNVNAPVASDHGEFYARWRTRLAELKAEILDMESETVSISNSRGAM